MSIRTGVIGSGAISDIYLTNMINRFDNLEVISIASRHLKNAEKKAQQYGIRACTVEEMLTDPEIDMVVILTPASTHYDLAKKALLAGKHVYTEKTMTDDFEKTKELVRLANEKGLYLGCAPDTFFGGAWQTARKTIDSGILGDIHSFVISTNRNNDVLLSLFSFLRMPGGGFLHDFGTYYLTALVNLLGPVKRAGGIVGAPYPERLNIIPDKPEYGTMMQTPYESEISAVLQLENGIVGTLHMDGESILQDQNIFRIYGTRGVLILSDPNEFGGSVRLVKNPMNFSEPVKEEILWNYSDLVDNLRGIGPSDMAEAIAKGEQNRASKELAYHVHEVIHSILKGSAEGRFVDIKSTVTRLDPVEGKSVPVKNIGHVSLQMNKDAEMLHFYEDILGMKKQFTLTQGSQKWITYMKLADHQFVELFYSNGKEFQHIDDRHNIYGYVKLNFEVDSIREIRDHLAARGVTLAEDIHPAADGSLEIKIFDPDGNEIRLTEYAKDGSAPLPLSKEQRESCSRVHYTTQVAYQVNNAANMLGFYTQGLGLKEVKGVKTDCPWSHYIEAGPHQYIQLFHTGEEKQKISEPGKYDGYQHLCLEVSDIHEAWDACIHNGLKPDREITLGPDGAYQFWLTDPDGNPVEMMEYTRDALQIQKSAEESECSKSE